MTFGTFYALIVKKTPFMVGCIMFMIIFAKEMCRIPIKYDTL